MKAMVIGDKVQYKVDRYNVQEATITGFYNSEIGEVTAILDCGSLGVQTALLKKLSRTAQSVEIIDPNMDIPIEIIVSGRK